MLFKNHVLDKYRANSYYFFIILNYFLLWEYIELLPLHQNK